jgi:hypothetical protein
MVGDKDMSVSRDDSIAYRGGGRRPQAGRRKRGYSLCVGPWGEYPEAKETGRDLALRPVV